MYRATEKNIHLTAKAYFVDVFKSFHKIAEETFPDYIDYHFLSFSINQENSQMAFHTFIKIKKNLADAYIF